MIAIPEKPLYLINKLNASGYKAYIVGGCVRDSILGLEPKDWDICTSATPEETATVFDEFDKIDNGIKHGTVGVIFNGEVFEITTFRSEGIYSDHRHPDNVRFEKNIEYDLARRDFTINAMAYNAEEGLVDIFDGRRDLMHGVIKCVGNPKARFNEDALRILRAIRFAGRFGFILSRDTKAAAFVYCGLLNEIPPERILPEFKEILLSRQAGSILNEYAGILKHVSPVAEGRDYSFLNTIPCDFSLRLAAVLCRVASCHTQPEDMRSDIKKLRLPSDVTKEVLSLFLNCRRGIPTSKYEIRKLISSYGIKFVCKLKHLYQVFGGRNSNAYASFEKDLTDILRREKCFNVSDLKVNGDDLIKLGAHGAQIGGILNALLENIFCGNIENDRDSELALAASLIGE